MNAIAHAVPLRSQVDAIHLVLSSLGTVVVDDAGVHSLRAEDASGSFGLLPGHADFLTVLDVGVVSWRGRDAVWRHAAVRRGVLTMRRGVELQIATREAILGDDLERLENDVLAQLRRRQDAEESSRRVTRQLEVRALRELVRPLRSRAAPPGEWP